MLQASYNVNLDVAGSAVGNKKTLKLRFQNEDPNPLLTWRYFLSVGVTEQKPPKNQNQTTKTNQSKPRQSG